MKRYLVHALGLALIVAGLTADGQFAQFLNNSDVFLSGANTWASPATLTNVTARGTFGTAGLLTVGAGLTQTATTLVPASAGTNYGIDLSATSLAYKSMTNHITFTGLTNNTLGAICRVLIYNGSGSSYLVRAPAGGIYSSTMAGLADWPITLTNTTALIVDIFGMGTASSNALYRATRLLP